METDMEDGIIGRVRGAAAVFRDQSSGHLFLDPMRIERARNGRAIFRGANGDVTEVKLEAFQTFQYGGVVYELWGQRRDGCWWVGRIDRLSRDDRALIAGQAAA